jgi:hypothetical protein
MVAVSVSPNQAVRLMHRAGSWNGDRREGWAVREDVPKVDDEETRQARKTRLFRKKSDHEKKAKIEIVQ